MLPDNGFSPKGGEDLWGKGSQPCEVSLKKTEEEKKEQPAKISGKMGASRKRGKKKKKQSCLAANWTRSKTISIPTP